VPRLKVRCAGDAKKGQKPWSNPLFAVQNRFSINSNSTRSILALAMERVAWCRRNGEIIGIRPPRCAGTMQDEQLFSMKNG
jgi:hypothetical protein